MEYIKYERVGLEDTRLLVKYRVQFLVELMGNQQDESINLLSKELESYFNEFIPLGKYVCWWAKDQDEVVGIGGMAIRQNPGSFKNPTGKVGYIMNMYTLPAYRRRGISSNILQKLINSGREMDISFFELHATKEGEPMYIKHGFEQHTEPTYRKYIE